MAGRSTTAERQSASARSSSSRASAARTSNRSGWEALLARGNRRLLRALAVRAKSRVVGAADPREREADDIAKRVASVEPRPELAPLGALGNDQPLDRLTRASMERGLGASLADVRVHTGSEAEDATDVLHARAFTTGADIVFARDEYRPHTPAGRELIAHELVHVLQQRAGAVERPSVQRQEEQHGTVSDAGVSDTAVTDAGSGDAGSEVLPGGTAGDGGWLDFGDTSVTDTAEGWLPDYATLFDPCAVDERSLDNQGLLDNWRRARDYVHALDAAHRHGEDQYWAYANLARRVGAERDRRAHAGHAWLNEDVTAVPSTLYRIELGIIPSTLVINRADANAEATNAATNGALVVTPDQFDRMLQRLGIPRMSPAEFFARQTAATAGPMVLSVPQQPVTQMTPAVSTTAGLFSLGQGTTLSPLVSPLGMTALPQIGSGFALAGGLPRSPVTTYNWGTFVNPVVTAGPYAYSPDAIGGFSDYWRGAMGEALYASATIMPGTSTPRVIDLNDVQASAPVYDFLDPTTALNTQLKTQLPEVPGGTPSLETVQGAWRVAFAQANPALRLQALALLRTQGNPNLTLQEMLLNTRFAVNPETVVAAQDSLVNSIRHGPADYEPILTALMGQQPIQVQHKGKSGAIVTYSDFTTLNADYAAGKISEARYRAAIAQVAQRARSQVVSSGIGAETHLRPLLDFRQRFDFRGASDFAAFPQTDPGRAAARELQARYFERIATPELMEAQLHGVPSTLARPAGVGGAVGLATSALLGLPQMAQTWDVDPYAGRRYLLNVGVGGAGGVISVTGDQLLRMGISQGGLLTAEALAARGMSVAPVSMLTPTARFAGSTAWGGVSSAGITLGGMYLQESLLGTDFGPSDYWSKTARAGAAGTVGAVGSALGTATAAAIIGAEGGGGACTLVVPGVGTVACGTVGAVVGFGTGLIAYYVFDATFGEDIEGAVRESMEHGCGGR